MPDDTQPCACWQMVAEDGQRHTAAWLGMHERIAVTTRDGHRIEGRPDGPVWFTREQGRELPGLGVELDDGTVIDMPLNEVQTITPLVAPDPERILEEVAHAVRHPFAIEDGQTGWTLIADSHHTVEVEITVRHTPCHGHTPGEPPFRFLIQTLRP
ncbi:hypothetical protein E9549_17505 [Blastococcus sp. MG754426]|uniref:hypothetical protein n=1 Tax=unclassified Blastococcus TaxID=2619396 RepID=UPI001EEFEA3E|nr:MULTISPECIES: hypothetical protein [unclassified Blastococcus]MCF6509184.1 hypothetical protein [Blastococcus sp. MG754426]MCF6513725.1 hypothetical protein [Blastococcus sp. MG754427]